MPSDAKEVAKIQFKDELKDLIVKNNAERVADWSLCVKKAIKPYKGIKTKETIYVLAYAGQLFDLIQKGSFDKEGLNKELKTPSLVSKQSWRSVVNSFVDIFKSEFFQVRY